MIQPLSWYVLYTRPLREELVRDVLLYKGYDVFLPKYRDGSRCSSRGVQVERPLFPSYVFCRSTSEITGKIVTTPGVLKLVGIGHHPTIVPEAEIERIRTLIASRLHLQPWQYLADGALVRIETGPLRGVTGILIHNGSKKLVVSITLLRRATAVTLDNSTAISTVSDPSEGRARWECRD